MIACFVLNRNDKVMDREQNPQSNWVSMAYPCEQQIITPPPPKVPDITNNSIHVTNFPFLRTQPQPSTIPLILVPHLYLYTPTEGLPPLTLPQPTFSELRQILEIKTRLSVDTQPQISAYLHGTNIIRRVKNDL